MDEGTDRKVVYPDDLLTYYKQWDAMILDRLPTIFNTPQPLLPYVPSATWQEVKKLERDPSQMISLLNCYYRQPDIAAPLT
jgi:hypothetical protein